MTKLRQALGTIENSVRLAGVIVALCTGLALVACGSKSSAAHNCSTDNTASVSFRNNSGGIANMYVHWDGINITGTLTDGTTSPVFTVSSVPHFLVFRISGGTSLACTGEYVTPGQCASTIYSCAG